VKGVARGLRVRWSVTVYTSPGTFSRGRPSTTEYEGIVLDRHPASGTWWVKPDGARDAVPVAARDMTPTSVMHRG
jgi:hypothetical protein